VIGGGEGVLARNPSGDTACLGRLRGHSSTIRYRFLTTLVKY
jgi:hypothetical protein